jgi:Prokaryotic membrane lipoprotein lipid attachment site
MREFADPAFYQANVSRGFAMKRILFLWSILILVAGCYDLPFRGADLSTDELKNELKVGVTKKSEVILMLGKPDIERTRYSYYRMKRYGTALFGTKRTIYNSAFPSFIDLYFEFDNHEILSDCQGVAYDNLSFQIEFEGPCKPSESHK